MIAIDHSPNILSVSRLNHEAQTLLEDEFTLIWIEGELSNLARPQSGHLYFSLKDEKCQVRCAMFRFVNRNLDFTPENGMQALLQAKVTLYPERGEFQLVVQQMQEAGEGALRRALETLRQRLEAEGLFLAEHKRALPSFPRAVGVITSPTGAALCDVLSVLERRYPMAEVIVYATPVQGATVGDAIAAMIDNASQQAECDVLLLVRGGGSLEDLWGFNQEAVARAIFRCSIPLITGIGHEIDVTIADWIADCRGATPSAAAELAVPDGAEWKQRIAGLRQRLVRQMQSWLTQASDQAQHIQRRLVHPQRQLQRQIQQLDGLTISAIRALDALLMQRRTRLQELTAGLARYHPKQRLLPARDRLRYLRQRLQTIQQHQLALARIRLKNAGNALKTVSPQRTLERGYAIALGADGRIVDDADNVAAGDIVQLRLANGAITVQVLGRY